jgi:hypothetical protein
LELFCNSSFLGGTAPTYAHRLCVFCDLKEMLFKPLIIQNYAKRLTINEEQHFWNPSVHLPQSVLNLIIARGILDLEDLLGLALKPGWNGYALGSLNLVPRQHPNLNAGASECLNGHKNILLEFVLHSCDSQVF